MTGLFVLTEDRWFIGTLLMLTLQNMACIEEDEMHSISLQARVVRQDKAGVGFEFVIPRHGESHSNHFQLDVLTNEKTLREFIARCRDRGSGIAEDVEQIQQAASIFNLK